MSKSQLQSNVWRSTTKRYHQPRASYQLCKHVVIQAYLNERYATFGFRDQYYLQRNPTQFKTGPDGSNINLDWQAGHCKTLAICGDAWQHGNKAMAICRMLGNMAICGDAHLLPRITWAGVGGRVLARLKYYSRHIGAFIGTLRPRGRPVHFISWS